MYIQRGMPMLLMTTKIKNTIKAGGSTVRAQNVGWVMDGWSG